MPLSRRALVAALLAAAPAAKAEPVPAIGSIAVDVGHLKAIGVGPLADLVKTAMADELRRLFADRIEPGRGVALVVRVTALHITAFANDGQGRRGGLSDSIDGEALLVGRRGEILFRLPQHAALTAHGTWYDPKDSERRTDRVARFYAQWLRQRL